MLYKIQMRGTCRDDRKIHEKYLMTISMDRAIEIAREDCKNSVILLEGVWLIGSVISGNVLLNEKILAELIDRYCRMKG